MCTEKDAAFDPYHKWLGIPKAQRPPTCYQVLGLAQGESDVEVIEESAIRQTTHLRAYQVGTYAAVCTRLLNEVSAARQTLVNPQKRQEYDAKLAQLAAKKASQNGNVKPVQPIIDSAFTDLDADVKVPGSSTNLKREAPKPTKTGKPGKGPKDEPAGLPLNLILGAAAGVLIVGLVAVVAFVLSPTPPPPQPIPVPPMPPIAANKMGQSPIVATPSPKPPFDPKIEPKVNPKPPVEPNPLDKVVNVEPIPPGTPELHRLGRRLLLAPAKFMQVLADGRLFYSGYPTILQYDPGRAANMRAREVAGTGERGARFAISPDGKMLYIGTPDLRTADAIDMKAMTNQGKLLGAGEVSALALSRDGLRLVIGSYAGEVQAYDAATCQQLQKLTSHPRPIQAIVFSRDGSLVATMCDQMVHIWNLRFGRLVSSAPIVPNATSIEFTPDDQSLLAASPTGLHQGPVNKLKWSLLRGDKDALRIAFANDKTLAVLGAQAVSLYDWPSMRTAKHTPVGGDPLETLALSPDGKILFAGRKTAPLEIFAVDDAAVLKPYTPGVPLPPNPNLPTPSMPGGTDALVGSWHYESVANGVIKLDIAIRKVGALYPVEVNMTEREQAGKAHADNLRLGGGGKWYGDLVVDADLSFIWPKVRVIVVDPPQQEGQLHIEIHGNALQHYTLKRVASIDIPKMPPDPPLVTPKVDVPVVRSDPPSDETFKNLAQTIRDTYKADYAKKSPADRAALAEKLLKLAAESKDDSTARFVLCMEARDLAAAAGKWSTVNESLERLDTFKVDRLEMRESALEVCMKSSPSKESALAAADAALRGVAESITADRLPLAAKFLTIAGSASKKSQSSHHAALVKKADGEMKVIAHEADVARTARGALKSTPDDAGANLAVGRYEALRRGDWETALPLLAKGGDADLAIVARKELSPPTDAADQKKLADEWWALATMEKDGSWTRLALQSRAGHWYRQAAVQATGLNLAIVTERLKLIDEAASPFPAAGTSSASTVTNAPEAKLLRGHKGAITCLDERGGILHSSSLDGTMKSWDVRLTKNLSTFSHAGPIYWFAYSPSGRFCAVGFKDTMKVVDAQGRTPVQLLPAGKAIPSAFWLDDDRITYFDGATHQIGSVSEVGTSLPHPISASALVASPTRREAVTLGEETSLIVLRQDGTLLRRTPMPAANSTAAAFSPKEYVVAVATSDKKIKMHNYRDNNSLKTVEGAAGTIRCMAYFPSGDRLCFGGDDGIIHVWDVVAGKEIRRFATGAQKVTSVLVSLDGSQIITGGSDGVIRVWPAMN